MSYGRNYNNPRRNDAVLLCVECGAPALTFAIIPHTVNRIGACGKHSDAITSTLKARSGALDSKSANRREFVTTERAKSTRGILREHRKPTY